MRARGYADLCAFRDIRQDPKNIHAAEVQDYCDKNQ